MDIGNNIKRLRKSKKYTQTDLAKLIGVQTSAVSAWELGRSKPLVDNLEALARVFKVPRSELMGYTSEEEFEIKRSNLLNEFTNLPIDEQRRIYDKVKKLIDSREFRSKNVPNTEVTTYGYVSAGTGEYMDEELKEVTPYFGNPPKHDFAVIVKGDSMEPLISDGQIIFVTKSDVYNTNSIVIARHDGRMYVKKYVKNADGDWLYSINPNFKPIAIDDLSNDAIVGNVSLN